MAPRSVPWLETLRRILAQVEASDVDELELAHEDFRLRVRRQVRPTAAPVILEEARAVDDDAHAHRVVAPLTGIFYRAASPTAKPYVREGDWVDADGVIGLVETMKIFNEVTADRPGRVTAFLVQSGQLVHAGDPLVVLEVGERAEAGPEEYA